MIFAESLAKGTRAQYGSAFNLFQVYCNGRGVDAFNIPVALGVEYLTTLYKGGKSYSNINTARSAISQYANITDGDGVKDFGKHPLVTGFMKGVFKLRPALPRYQSTWDVGAVLDNLSKIDNDTATFKQLSLKCATLLALTSGQRVQTLAALSVDKIHHKTDGIVLTVDTLLKTSRPGFHSSVELCRFVENDSICPVKCIMTYTERTSAIRECNQLFISVQKPHGPVSSQTISRWICSVLHEAGVPNCFKAHSVRSAATSKAVARTDINIILRAAGWSSRRTFDKFYNKPLHSAEAFSTAVLS